MAYKSMKTWVEIHDEEKLPGRQVWHLCFQNVTYHYDDGSTENGYRFIWRRPNGTLQAARGQARIPDAVWLNRLIKRAKSKGWFK